MHFLFIAGVGKKSPKSQNQPPHDLQLSKNCIKINIYFLYINVNKKLQIATHCIRNKCSKTKQTAKCCVKFALKAASLLL